MSWKALLISLITLAGAGYLYWAGRVAVPQIRYFATAALGQHVVHKIRIVSIKKKWKQA